MQNKLNDRFPICLIHCCLTTFRPQPLNREPLRFVFVSTQLKKLESVVLGCALSNSYVSLELFKLPTCIGPESSRSIDMTN